MDKEYIQNVLNKWATYSNYDPKQKEFNLLSVSYEFHQMGRTIEKLLQIEPTGQLAALYLGYAFIDLLSACKVSVWDVIREPNLLADEMDMASVFLNNNDFRELEQTWADGVTGLYSVFGKNLRIGILDAARDDFKEAVQILATETLGLHTDIFAKTGEPMEIRRIFPELFRFHTVAEACIQFLSDPKYNHSLLLAYIQGSEEVTANGYFSFFLISDGNILSINDRVDEAYQGQHGHSRNGRWMERKSNIFPYRLLKVSEETDYLGYPKRIELPDDLKSVVSEDSVASYCLLLMFLLLKNKYHGTILEGALKYSDQLVCCSQGKELPGLPVYSELSVPQAGILKNHMEFAQMLPEALQNKAKAHPVPGFHKEYEMAATDILNGRIARYGYYDTVPAAPEFIGDSDRLTDMAYMNARQKTADDLIRSLHDQYKVWRETGNNIHTWYTEQIRKNLDGILKICALWYADKGKAEAATVSELYCSYPVSENLNVCIDMIEGTHCGYPGVCLNEPLSNDTRKCLLSDYTANVWFVIRPATDRHIEILIGHEPDIPFIKGYRRRGHEPATNYLLNMYDPVDFVGTVFEERTLQYIMQLYPEEKDAITVYERFGDQWLFSEYHFTVCIGVSRRELSKLVRKYKK